MGAAEGQDQVYESGFAETAYPLGVSPDKNQLLGALMSQPGSSFTPRIMKVEDIAGMEELRKLGTQRNLAEELYRRIGPFDFEKN